MCGVGDARHLECTGESIVQQTDPEGREKSDYGVLSKKIGKSTMCVHNTKTFTHRASERREPSLSGFDTHPAAGVD